MGEQSAQRRSSVRNRAQKRRVLTVTSESDEDSAPEGAPQLGRAGLDALEEELAAEEERLQVCPTMLADVSCPGLPCGKLQACRLHAGMHRRQLSTAVHPGVMTSCNRRLTGTSQCFGCLAHVNRAAQQPRKVVVCRA